MASGIYRQKLLTPPNGVEMACIELPACLVCPLQQPHIFSKPIKYDEHYIFLFKHLLFILMVSELFEQKK